MIDYSINTFFKMIKCEQKQVLKQIFAFAFYAIKCKTIKM